MGVVFRIGVEARGEVGKGEGALKRWATKLGRHGNRRGGNDGGGDAWALDVNIGPEGRGSHLGEL